MRGSDRQEALLFLASSRHEIEKPRDRPEAAIFGDPATIAAGAFRPTGVAREVDGGYRVTGR